MLTGLGLDQQAAEDALTALLAEVTATAAEPEE